MPDPKPDYAILTHIMQARHLDVLDDWISFSAHKPDLLVLVIGDSPDIAEAVNRYGKERDIPIRIAAITSPAEIKEGETKLLKQQFEQTPTDYALLVKLDTFPHRDGQQDWLKDGINFIDQTDALFLTGSSLKYRSDTPTELPHVTFTDRISNNFLLIRPKTWLFIQGEMSADAWRFGRYDSEGLIELYCERTGKTGLRRLNMDDWRVIHTQAWDETADDIRKAIHAGGPALQSFMARYEDDVHHNWERYFMYRRPKAIKRVRMHVGRIRRTFAERAHDRAAGLRGKPQGLKDSSTGLNS